MLACLALLIGDYLGHGLLVALIVLLKGLVLPSLLIISLLFVSLCLGPTLLRIVDLLLLLLGFIALPQINIFMV